MDSKEYLQAAFGRNIRLVDCRSAQSGDITGSCFSFAVAYQPQVSEGSWMYQEYWLSCLCPMRLS